MDLLSKKTNYLYFRICEFCLGSVCFGLFAKYFIIVNDYGGDTLQMGIVKNGIAFVAADAFPFLVQIPFLIVHWKHGRAFQYNILNAIVSLAGAIVYTTSGSICLHVVQEMWYTPQGAIGSMFVITGAVYLLDLGYWMKYLRKEPEHISDRELQLQNPWTMPAADPNQQYNTEGTHPYPVYHNGPPSTQLYMANPNSQYINPMAQPYMADPNQQYSNPMARPHMADPNQQYGIQMAQPNMVQPNQQYGIQMAQPNMVQPNRPYGNRMAQ